MWSPPETVFKYSVKLEVTLANPADLPEEQAEGPADDGGQDEAYENEAEPVHGRGHNGRRAVRERHVAGGEPAGPYAYWPAQAAGAHA